jgi:hypothetical protein
VNRVKKWIRKRFYVTAKRVDITAKYYETHYGVSGALREEVTA